MSEPILSIRDLHVRFAVHGATVEAVRGVSFDVAAGASVALVGESGSGKSVIARAIMGLLPATATIDEGRILWRDPQQQEGAVVDIATLAPTGRRMRALRGGRMSLIFQEPMVSLSALHTIGDQISEALFLHRQASRSEGMELTREMLAQVGFPEPARALDLYPFELSGGMRQRAMIAMALICRPALLIADEPTTALDVTIQAQILKLMMQLREAFGMAVLMITHDLGVVANVAEEVVVLYHGEVMERAPVRPLFRRARHPYTRALLHAVPHLGMAPGERLTPLREVKAEADGFLMGGGAAAGPAIDPAMNPAMNNNEAAPDAAPEVILRVRHVSKGFGVRAQAWALGEKAPMIRAVHDVSFEVRRGECLGLVGESGSGKSTLGKLIAHAITPDEGTMEYADEDGACRVDAMEDAALFAYRRKVQYMFQDPVGSLNPSMTLFDILREPLEIHKRGNRAEQMEQCSELMRLVGLDPRHLRRYPHSFSGGQRQRIGIARALALRPRLLICDEPVSALDVSIQAQVLNLMKDLQQALGLSYLFISHNLAVVDYVADRIAVMYRGEFVELAPRESLFARPTHPYTRTLLQAVPVADVDAPLDFARIAEPGDAAAAWPAPYHGAGRLYEIAPDHLVRAAADPGAAAPSQTRLI